jgi:heme oxygenase (biliverdin-producing, ferredoxin)
MAGSSEEAIAVAAAVTQPASDARAKLTEMMRARTSALHTRAERSGIINDVLRGKASRYGYALLLRNLLPAYHQLEAGLEAHRHSPAVCAAASRELYRSPALRSDLNELFGREWESALPLVPAGEKYGRQVAIAAGGDGTRLIAHAYSRYFGDLSGGQILKRLLGRAPGLQARELSFYDFPEIGDAAAFKDQYRRLIDEAAATIIDAAAVVDEAVMAFELNIAVSEAVKRAIAPTA